MPEDHAKALRLFQLAANQGIEIGQYNVGFYHELGLGGAPKDLRLAKHYYGLAAAQGDEPASESLSKLPEGELPSDHDEPPPATAHEFDVERRRLNEEAEEALRAMRAMMLKELGVTSSAKE